MKIKSQLLQFFNYIFLSMGQLVLVHIMLWSLRSLRRWVNTVSAIEFYIPTAKITSNDIIAGNGRVLKFYLFIVWLYLFKKIYNVNDFFSFWCILVLHLMVVVYNIINIWLKKYFWKSLNTKLDHSPNRNKNKSI